MTNASQKKAKTFYGSLKAEGLHDLATVYSPPRSTLKSITPFLSPADRILDLCCGYGRIALPLKQRGYDVHGIDILSELISTARKSAKKLNLEIEFLVGDMCHLPYQDESFDKILCLWNSFNHLLTKELQQQALVEIYRVLKAGGIAFLETFDGESEELEGNPDFKAPFLQSELCGATSTTFVHTRKTLKELCRHLPFVKSRAVFKDIGGRRRIVLLLHKK